MVQIIHLQNIAYYCYKPEFNIEYRNKRKIKMGDALIKKKHWSAKMHVFE